MRKVANLRPAEAQSKEDIELVCSSGHRTIHSGARGDRLKDAWCARCGSDTDYATPPMQPGRHPIGAAEERPRN